MLGLFLFLVLLLVVAVVIIIVQAVKIEAEHSEESVVGVLQTQVQNLEQQIADILQEHEVKAVRLRDMVAEDKTVHERQIMELNVAHTQALKDYKHKLELEFEQKKRHDRETSNRQSRAALTGKIGQHVAPLLPDFKYNLKEVRWCGDPFDLVVLDGLEEKDSPLSIIFVEVKTGKTQLAKQIKGDAARVRDAVEKGRVAFDVYVPEVFQQKSLTVVTGSSGGLPNVSD